MTGVDSQLGKTDSPSCMCLGGLAIRTKGFPSCVSRVGLKMELKIELVPGAYRR